MPIAEQSVQALLIFMRFGTVRISSGTAFVVQSAAGPLLITNRHNVTGRDQHTGDVLDKKHSAIPDSLEVVHNAPAPPEGGLKLEWSGRIEPLLRSDGSPRWIEHPKLGERADFVALPLTQIENVRLYPIDPAHPGRPIAIGPRQW